MGEAAIIRLEGIRKNYGENRVLDGFNLEILPGEFITAIGSSGSGKTTVLKLINGLLAPDAGTVFVDGTDIATVNQDRLRRRIGYVIQGIGLFPHMRIGDNIAFVLNLDKADAAAVRRRVEELCETVSLSRDLLRRYPHELSGGQKQRVGIARALAAKPGIMLMDEPFGAVDEITRKSLQEEIRAIHARLGLTVFFITHDINEALSLGSRTLVMRKGRIEQFDRPDVIENQPATEFVAKLLASRGVCH